MSVRTVSSTTLALFVAGMIGVAAQAPAPAVKRTILVQGDLSAPGREGVMALAEVAAGGATGRHTHPGEEISYVLAGPVTVDIDGKPSKVYQTGESFLIPAGTIHNAKNTGTGVLKVVVTYVVEKGKPVTSPVQ